MKFFFNILFIYLYIYIYFWLCWVFVSARGLSLSCGKRGPLFIAVRGPLTIAASLVAEHRLQTRRLSSCGLRAQLLRGMWDLPRPGLEPVSPALAGRFSTTAPPGKPSFLKFLSIYIRIISHSSFVYFCISITNIICDQYIIFLFFGMSLFWPVCSFSSKKTHSRNVYGRMPDHSLCQPQWAQNTEAENT